MKDLGIHKDGVIGASYTLQLLDSAKKLSAQLKDTYGSMKIDFKKFNTDNDGSEVEKNPPVEIYEYQNFFLLEKTDGNIVLLDGFRRLLWYNAPDSPVMVRTYKQSELTNSQILTLLVNLNHFKFFSESSYQERGFGLLLKTVFDIDITKFRDAFDAYLSSNATTNSYTSRWDDASGSGKIELIKERILNPRFVDDMNFIAKANKEGFMVNEFFGALVYQKRQKKKEAFDVDKFIKLHKSDKVLADLMVKFKKAGTNSSAKSQVAVNQIQEMYNNFFVLMDGGKIEKSYAEKVQECKDIREQINKDKDWTKLTGTQNFYDIEKVMAAKPKEMKFKCVVMPRESYEGVIPLVYGLNELVQITGKETPRFMRETLTFGFKDPETTAVWEVQHNYGGYNSYGKRCTKVSFEYNDKLNKKYEAHHSTSYDIELWVNIPKSTFKEKK